LEGGASSLALAGGFTAKKEGCFKNKKNMVLPPALLFPHAPPSGPASQEDAPPSKGGGCFSLRSREG